MSSVDHMTMFLFIDHICIAPHSHPHYQPVVQGQYCPQVGTREEPVGDVLPSQRFSKFS